MCCCCESPQQSEAQGADVCLPSNGISPSPVPVRMVW